MPRPSPWLIAVVLLLGVFILREPRLQKVDDLFLGWFVRHTEQKLTPASVTVVEIGRDDFQQMIPPQKAAPLAKGEAPQRSLSPLEYALFLQAVLDFKPTVVALEPLAIWRKRDKVQEQVFIDQAMRVPKLVVAEVLGGPNDQHPAPDDLPTFPNVAGDRGDLPEFAGISHAPDDDIRLISSPGFINLPDDRGERLRVPLLFVYRGEIIPSFTLQAILLWLRITPAEVKIELGSRIVLPNGWQIPIHRDGTFTINPLAKQSVRRLSLNQLLLAAQEHEKKTPPTMNLDNLRDQIVLLRLLGDPLQPPDVFAAALATIQTASYLRPAPPAIGWIIVLLAALLSGFLWRISKGILALGVLLAIAGYALLALGILGSSRVWLPTFLPLALMGFLLVLRLFVPSPKAPPAKVSPS